MHRSSKKFSIKQWNKDDRPREKLLIKGKGSLSNAELIAILLGSGSINDSAVELAKRMLHFTSNDLNKFSRLSVHDLTKFKGVGKAKAVRIIAAFELAHRCSIESAERIASISSSKEAFELIHPMLSGIKHEEVWILYLNNANKILHKMQLSKGGLTSTLVDLRLIFNKAIELLATGVIVCHNHPSGSLRPSQADKNITKKLVRAGETLDIKVIDHLIITEKDYFSFADSNLL